MNTNIHMTLETLPFSFRMAKSIWKSKVIQVILPKKKEQLHQIKKDQEMNKKASSRVSDSFVTF